MTSEQIFLELLDRHVSDCAIEFDVAGRRTTAGARNAARSTALIGVHVAHPRFFDRVLCYGNLGMGESYMDGDFEVVDGELHELLTLLLRHDLGTKIRHDYRMVARILMMRVANMVRGREGNVRRHYDIGDDLFESFLDSTLTYSCGYAESPHSDLEQLQRDKLDRICRKLALRKGERLVDIGCGYGGLLIFAAEHFGVSGVGITSSRRHHERATAAVQARGLGDRVTIRLGDYRELDGQFEKVVSVGMMEHVPRREYARYVRTIARLMAPGAVGLVHAIGRTRASHDHDPFIQRYVFPNTDTPRLSEIATQLERRALAIIDVENMVRHYGYTVLRWLERFRANRGRLAERYDARFQRLWEYYFACGIAASRAAHSALWQVLFTNDRAGERPLRRV